MTLNQQDAQRLLQMLKKETGGKILPRKRIVGYIVEYVGLIPQDIREKYTMEDLYNFLSECWDYGTFDNW
jgi:hypothetical protein